jgi:hypothetical protein
MIAISNPHLRNRKTQQARRLKICDEGHEERMAVTAVGDWDRGAIPLLVFYATDH